MHAFFVNSCMLILHQLGRAGVDAALYMESEYFTAVINRFSWDLVYQAREMVSVLVRLGLGISNPLCHGLLLIW